MTDDLPQASVGFPVLPPLAPQAKSAWRRAFGVFMMRLTGWRIQGNAPNLPKFILIVAPHTSNWDFFYGALAYFALRLDTVWLVKDSAIKGPLGALAKHFGAAPIDRANAGSVVQAYVREFERRERMMLTITPEGTRKKVPDWKRGFYHIAMAAKVPIVPVAFDFRSRRIVFNPVFFPTGDMEGDVRKIQQLYSKEIRNKRLKRNSVTPECDAGYAKRRRCA
jgi:1-acyl-sn-glycerol-3-phosphate acyltransferase